MLQTSKGKKIESAREKEYGTEKGKRVYYASIVKGKIKDEEVKKEVGRFVEYATSDSFKEKPLTDAEDIAWANRVIDLVVGKLP